MIEHIAGRQRSHAEALRHAGERGEPCRLARAAVMREAKVAAIGEEVGHPAQIDVVGSGRLGIETGDECCDQTLGMRRDIVPVEETLAFLAVLRIGATLADRQQRRQAAPRGAILRPDQHGGAIDQIKPTAGDRADAQALLGQFVASIERAHHARDRVAIGHAERGHAHHRSGCEQILGRGGTAQEREVRRHLQFGIVHCRKPEK